MAATDQTSTPTFETPLIEAPTADGYRRALKTLAERAQAFYDDENADSRDLFRYARQLEKEQREHNHQPRQEMSRCDVYHSALQRFIDVIYEFVDLEDHDGRLVSSWKVWEEFHREVKSALRTVEQYPPGDTTWAPDDDTNPPKTTPVPEPDPTAGPINGIRQGDYVSSSWDEKPRRVLTGVVDHPGAGPSVRLSDPRDGTYFGGYFIQVSMLGTDFKRVDQSSEQSANKPASAATNQTPGTPER